MHTRYSNTFLEQMKLIKVDSYIVKKNEYTFCLRNHRSHQLSGRNLHFLQHDQPGVCCGVLAMSARKLLQVCKASFIDR